MATLAALVSLVVVLVVGDGEEPTDEQLPPPAKPTTQLRNWSPVVLPGAGVFIDLASGPNGAVAVTAAGTDWAALRRSSHVWASDSALTSWTWVDVEGGPTAAITSVVWHGDTIIAAGYLHDDEVEPALWNGTAETGLRLVDTSLPAIERLRLVRQLDGVLAVIGVDAAGSEGSDRLLIGSPDEWTDLTPPGAVEISEIVSTGEEWIAVGMSQSRRPGIWHSRDRGVSWMEQSLTVDLPATISDVTVAGAEVYAIARISPMTSPRSQLLRRAGDSWEALGDARTIGISWLASVQGRLFGGTGPPSRGDSSRPHLWEHQGEGRWTTVTMQLPGGHDFFPVTFAAATDHVVAGTVFGQPALWLGEIDGAPQLTGPLAPTDPRLWERIATLPPETIDAKVLAHGRIAATAWSPDVAGLAILLLGEDGTTWNPLPLPPDFQYVRVLSVDDRLVIVGVTDATVVIGRVEGDEYVELAEVEGTQLEAIDVHDGNAIVYVRLAGTTTRTEVPILSDGPPRTAPLDWRPVFIQTFGNGVVAGGGSDTGNWPGDTLQVSTDAGATWTELEVSPTSVVAFGPELVVTTGLEPMRTYLVTLDPLRLDPVDLPPELIDTSGRPMSAFAGGLATYDPSGVIHLLEDLDAMVTTLELSPATGFDGVFLFPASDDGHLMALESGEWVLYRWTGDR